MAQAGNSGNDLRQLNPLDSAAEAQRNEDSLTVAELIALAQDALDDSVGGQWVTGEVFEYRGPHRSGHHYFKLREKEATLEVKIWRGTAKRAIQCPLEEGRTVRVHGQFDVWPPRGNLSFIIDRVEDVGVGDLARQLELLKEKLKAEGLFDEDLKKPIPLRPIKIAVLTGGGSAAEADILQTFKDSQGPFRIWMRPVVVQGAQAVGDIIQALEECAAVEADVILLARGGGSLEDLWAFQEEPLVRAVSLCEIPIVSAIGHESDFTLVDFVSDQRAKTPTAGAISLCQGWREAWDSWDWLWSKLNHGMEDLWQRKSRGLERLTFRIQEQSPARRLESAQARLQEAEYRLMNHMDKRLTEWNHRLSKAQARLDSASPERVLGRGYALVRPLEGGSYLKNPQDLQLGQALEVQLSEGRFEAEVTGLKKA